MRFRTAGKVVTVLLGALLFPLLVLSSPAAAWDPPSGDPGDVHVDDNGQATGVRYGCRVSAGPAYLGLSCPGVNSGLTREQIFCSHPKLRFRNKDKYKPKDVYGRPRSELKENEKEWGHYKGCLQLRECWEERPVTKKEMAEMKLDAEEGFTYYWRYCLRGIDLDPPYHGDPEISTEVYKKPDGEEIVKITEQQEQLLEPHESNNSVPRPFAVAAPNPNVLVYRPVAFYDWRSEQLQDDSMEVPAGDVYLKAVVSRTKVEPMGAGKGSGTAECDGHGVKVQPGDTPESKPGACWYTYEQSSAGEDGDVYHVNMTTHWKVYVLRRGAEGTLSEDNFFTEFDKSAVTRVPVREVQTVVIH